MRTTVACLVWAASLVVAVEAYVASPLASPLLATRRYAHISAALP